MIINPLTPNIMHLFSTEPVSAGRSDGHDITGGFGSIFNESMQTANFTDNIDRAHTMQLLMGEADDLSGMLIDMQKAELSLQLALQIRNKLIDAYNEIMRMSI